MTDFGFVVVPRSWAKQVSSSLARIERALGIVIENEEQIMSDQDHVEQDVQAIGASVDQIVAEIAALKAQPGASALDFTSLDALVARVQGVATDNAPPAVEPAPAEVSADVPTEVPAE